MPGGPGESTQEPGEGQAEGQARQQAAGGRRPPGALAGHPAGEDPAGPPAFEADGSGDHPAGRALPQRCFLGPHSAVGGVL